MRLIFVVMLILAASGCTNTYYGFSHDEWEAMTPEQQAETKSKYQKVLAEKGRLATGNTAEVFKDRAVTGVTGDTLSR